MIRCGHVFEISHLYFPPSLTYYSICADPKQFPMGFMLMAAGRKNLPHLAALLSFKKTSAVARVLQSIAPMTNGGRQKIHFDTAYDELPYPVDGRKAGLRLCSSTGKRADQLASNERAFYDEAVPAMRRLAEEVSQEELLERFPKRFGVGRVKIGSVEVEWSIVQHAYQDLELGSLTDEQCVTCFYELYRSEGLLVAVGYVNVDISLNNVGRFKGAIPSIFDINNVLQLGRFPIVEKPGAKKFLFELYSKLGSVSGDQPWQLATGTTPTVAPFLVFVGLLVVLGVVTVTADELVLGAELEEILNYGDDPAENTTQKGPLTRFLRAAMRLFFNDDAALSIAWWSVCQVGIASLCRSRFCVFGLLSSMLYTK